MQKGRKFFQTMMVGLLLFLCHAIPSIASTDDDLLEAVLEADLSLVTQMIQSGIDINYKNRNGVTPLSLALENGDAPMTDLLLSAGADPNLVGLAGETPLMIAAHTGIARCADLLIKSGALIDMRDNNFSQTALMIAAREGHQALAEVLLRYGAQVNLTTRIGPEPPYLPPCKGTGCGSEGEGINRSGVPHRGERYERKGGFTALNYAARQGHTELVALLLESGANKELPEANGITPILMALLNNQLAVADLLLEAGAEINVSDFYGRTPLFAAIDFRNLDLNSSLEDSPSDNNIDRKAILPLIEKLLRHGAIVDARTKEWPPEKKWLYSLNDVSWVDMTGQTPFIRAAAAGDLEVMQLLLEYHADPLITTYEGTTALMVAAGVNWTVDQTFVQSEEDLLKAVELIFNLGSDINAKNSMGVTALHGAANKGANSIIKFLAENGANLNARDNVGRDAIQWAEGVFLAAVGAEQKPTTIKLLRKLHEEL
jgi:ankyrin repeat protein